MFTGLIQEMGTLISCGGGRLVIRAGKISTTCRIGDSIAVNGVCLTAVDISPPLLTMNMLAETAKRTNLEDLKPGEKVNLEPALQVGGELGGHFVTGHVDGEGKLISSQRKERDWIFRVKLPPGLQKYVVKKGSIAIEGISLTIASVDNDVIAVHIIPHTYLNTNLQHKTEGAGLNLETDLLGKYVINYLENRSEPDRSIDRSFLKETGFI